MKPLGYNHLSQFPSARANPDRSCYLRGIQTEGVGTIRSNPGIHFADDGGLSSDNDDSDEETDFVDTSDTTPSPSASPKPLLDIYIPPSPSSTSSTPATTADPRPPIQTSRTHNPAQFTCYADRRR